MARNALQNALRWQEHLGNQTTCHSCAVNQALSLTEQKEKQIYSCACGEIILVQSTDEEVFCPKCAQKMIKLNCCTSGK